MQLLAEKINCGVTTGEWFDKLPTLQVCVEECKKIESFKRLVEYSRRDVGDSTCNANGCDCRCVTGSCTRTATPGYDLYKVTEGMLKRLFSQA